MTDTQAQGIAKAREAVRQLRDAARLGQVIRWRERDPLVMAIHAAIDRAEAADEALREICESLRCGSDEVLETVQRLVWSTETEKTP